MELMASNIATCTIATTRCAAGGVARRHEGDGLLIPIGDYIGERRRCRRDQRDRPQRLAKIGLHAVSSPVCLVRASARAAARARAVASVRRSSHVGSICSVGTASGLMSGTHATRPCAYLVADLYRRSERDRTNA